MKELAAAIALITFGAFSASAQELHQFLGPSNDKFNGRKGYFSYHQACQRTFPGSMWCTTNMIIEGGPAEGVLLPPSATYWVNTAPLGIYPDIDGYAIAAVDDFADRADHLNCKGWTTSGNTETGVVLAGPAGTTPNDINVTNGSFTLQGCDQEIPVACCQGPTTPPAQTPHNKVPHHAMPLGPMGIIAPLEN